MMNTRRERRRRRTALRQFNGLQPVMVTVAAAGRFEGFF
jgi:hypothetical protein